ncbi:MAG: glutamate--tRNA ligase [Oligoflexia bacterium]|nr:glutamate--tRNA ligase [Oligoflexia bacterium]
MSRPVRVRFAPSPTGYLHVGGARTFLFNWLFARHHGGAMILRVEDTDTARSTREFEEMQKQDMAWLGLPWDEGPGLGLETPSVGSFGPYRQSERMSIYAEHAQVLLNKGHAYYCFCTDAELEEKKKLALASGRPPHYDGKCRAISPQDAQKRLAQGEKGAVRFWIKNPKAYKLKDLIRGEIEFQEGMVGDFVILRTGGMPVYNFCCVIDDHLMEISHVLRAEEHLSNTVRQLMLYEAYGWTPPDFGHMSVVLGPDKQKLSKRHGATSVNDYKENGYLKEAINNYIALLGWSSPDHREILPLNEMVALFGTDRINSAPAVFDGVKLKWMNSQYLRAMDELELWKMIEPILKKHGLDFSTSSEAWIKSAVAAFKTSMETLVDCVPLFHPLSDSGFSVGEEAAPVLGWPTTKRVIEVWISELKKGNPQSALTEEEFTQLQKDIQLECQVKGKEFFQALRVAIVGKPHGTELKLLIPLLFRESLINRAQKVLSKMS